MKKGLKIAGIIFAVLLLLLLIVPFFVNVEKFRPEIEQKAGEALHSKVQLGALSLRLIPELSIHADSISVVPLDPRFPEAIIKSDSFKISLPLLSLLGSPSAALILDKPDIFIVQRAGIFNFQTMTHNANDPAKTATPNDADSSNSFIMRKLASATLTVDVTNAKFVYKTATDNVTMTVDQLLAKNLGYNSPIEIKIVSNVDYNGESGEVKGPFEFSGNIATTKQADNLAGNFSLVGDFSKMLIKTGATFHKPANTPLKFDMKGDFKKGATTTVNVADLKFELATFKLAGKLAASGIENRDTGTVDVDIRNQSSRLEDLAALSPLLADYQLKGALEFYAKIKGPVKNPALDIEVKADNLKGKTPKLSLPIEHLNVKLRVNGTLQDPVIQLDPADMLIGRSDLRLRLSASGLKAPQVKVDLQSRSLDLAFLSSGKESQAAKPTAEVKGKPLDASLDEMAPTVEKALKNKLLDRAHVDLAVNFGELKLEGARLVDVKLSASLANRIFKINQGSITGYGGIVKLGGTSQLIPAAPTYDYNLSLQNIDLAQVIAAHAPSWKGQLSGTLKADTKIGGQGLHKDQIAKNLHGLLKGEILKGNTSLQLSKIVSAVMKQLPQRPDLKGNVSQDRLKGKFKTMQLDSKIAGRKVNFTNLDIVFEPDEYQLGEMEYKADGSLSFDKQLDLTGNVMLSPQVVKWPEAVGGSGKIEIPVKVSGPMDNAKPDIGYTISKMGNRLLKKTAEKEGKKLLDNVLKGKNPGDFLKNIFH